MGKFIAFADKRVDSDSEIISTDEILKVFESSKIREAFENNDGVVRCMDGGIDGGLQMAGSGILLPRKNLTLSAKHPACEFFEKFGIQLSDDLDKVLLPNEDYLRILKELKEKNIVTGVSAHEDCGAAGKDLERILKAMKVPVEKIDEMKSAGGWQEVVNQHAKFFSTILAEALEASCLWIPIEKMDRELNNNTEQAFYIDCIGGKQPDFAFDKSKTNLPNGFTIHPELSDWENIFDRLEKSLDIAHVAERFSTENPFQIILIDDSEKPVSDEILTGVKQAVAKCADCVVVKRVTPNL